jgi:hypothetical protein
MQHEPIGDVDSDGEQAKFSNGHDIDKEPDNGERQDIRQRGEQDLETASAQTETDTFGYRIVKGDRKYSFRLTESALLVSCNLGNIPKSTCFRHQL